MENSLTADSAYVGEGAALLAAFLWAAATLMFGRLGLKLSPLVLNIVKGVCAIAMMLITLGIQFAAVGWPVLPLRSTVLLVLSGALGIGLGDTAYFSAINALGARRALLLETLAPPIAAVLAWIFLAEQLPIAAVTGIVITLLGIAWVISERVPGETRRRTGAGVKVALLATFCQAAGAVLSRAALANTTVSPLWSSVIRLFSGLIFMCTLALLRSEYLETASLETVLTTAEEEDIPSRSLEGLNTDDIARRRLHKGSIARARWQRVITQIQSPQLIASVAAVSFFATYLGIWLQQVSLKYTEAGIAQALLATSPLFIIPMAALLGEKLSWRAVLGVAVSLCGVWLLLLPG